MPEASALPAGGWTCLLGCAEYSVPSRSFVSYICHLACLMIRQNDFPAGKSNNRHIAAPLHRVIQQLPNILRMAVAKHRLLLRLTATDLDAIQDAVFRNDIVE